MNIEQQLLENQKDILTEIGNLKQAFSTVRTIVLGTNGGGHERRLRMIEKYVTDHPQECPAIKGRLSRVEKIRLTFMFLAMLPGWLLFFLR